MFLMGRDCKSKEIKGVPINYPCVMAENVVNDRTQTTHF